jgi:alginate O-acetyltransferase complex protein AlgI
MLFNSYEFIFLFMPVVFAGFFLIARKSHQGAIAWLSFASIFFYAYWSLYALPVIVISIYINYWIGFHLSNLSFKYRQPLLVLAIILNLLALGYFKYANFFIANTNALRSVMGMESLNSLNVILPIGISFFTFTQIAFLIDTYQDKVKERSFLQYVLFVSFFPHLLAGPVLHHKQMMPQFSDPKTFSIDYEKIRLGIIIFTIGLAKKILLADSLAPYADTLFSAVENGETPQFLMSWFGSLAYTFQLYFDFSGYSDMAVGIALFFGIWLPFNFNSPFQATNIIDFWQRWHITLTKYVGEYLYTPITLKFMRLGQNKSAGIETIFSLFIPTLLIFLILGLWHGANWTYVVFGSMHGLYIVINHLWRKIFPPPNKKSKKMQPHRNLKRIAGWGLTFFAVNIANIMFRADSISTAISIYKGILGIHGIHIDQNYKGLIFNNIIHGAWQSRLNTGQTTIELFLLIVISLLIILLFKNTSELEVENYQGKNSIAKKNWMAIFFAIIFLLSISQLNKTSPFLYFQY